MNPLHALYNDIKLKVTKVTKPDIHPPHRAIIDIARLKYLTHLTRKNLRVFLIMRIPTHSAAIALLNLRVSSFGRKFFSQRSPGYSHLSSLYSILSSIARRIAHLSSLLAPITHASFRFYFNLLDTKPF